MTPFRGEQTGEQNASKWNKKGNTPVYTRGTRYLFVVDMGGTFFVSDVRRNKRITFKGLSSDEKAVKRNKDHKA